MPLPSSVERLRAAAGAPPRDPRGGMGMSNSRPPRMPVGSSSPAVALGHHAGRNFKPLAWDAFYDSRRTLDARGGQFTVYEKGAGKTLLLMLHGGGHSALSWAAFARDICSRCAVRAVAFDQRGHGTTAVADEQDLSLDTLIEDLVAVAQALVDDAVETVILLGHSMGGAVVAHAAARAAVPKLGGVVVVDVVEGSAMDALSGMMRFLRSRPVCFASEEEAIRWSIRSGQLHNVESARVSMPAQLTPVNYGQVAAQEDAQVSDTLSEEPEADSGKAQRAADATVYTWRVDLAKTEPFWRGWFQGLSKAFLAPSHPKMLLLAGVDRLDKDLTIGQMQGKFQMSVVGGVGHSVQEDSPEQAADNVAQYLLRMRLAEPASVTA